jgi:hypothetical protein
MINFRMRIGADWRKVLAAYKNVRNVVFNYLWLSHNGLYISELLFQINSLPEVSKAT